MNEDPENVKNTIIMLIDVIKKYGTVHQYHYRPLKECFSAGVSYAIGGVTGLAACVIICGAMEYLFRLVTGWLP